MPVESADLDSADALERTKVVDLERCRRLGEFQPHSELRDQSSSPSITIVRLMTGAMLPLSQQ